MALEKEDARWKKSEDEILRQGVMKYGLNQWHKVASLLKRTASECKSRYYNYLCSNNQWSSEDINRLVELARYLKPQWKLIGDILGKNEQDCYEEYIKTVYKEIDISKPAELMASTDEYDKEDVAYAMSRIEKKSRKRQ